MIVTIMLLCAAGFIAAAVDSIAGGGGLISLPALLLAGVPPYYSLGTNKFASTSASLTSSLKYARSGKINFKLVRYMIPCTLIGAVVGVKCVLNINEKILYPMVLVMVLFVGIYSLVSRTIGAKDESFDIPEKRQIIKGCLLAFGLGFYDGFFGPGTGSFLIFGLIGIFKFNFIKAAGNARILNFTSNITALVLFALSGKIRYFYGIPFAIAMILGARVGTSFALKHGTRLIKPIFVTMSLCVAAKMLFNIF
jgi:uncharacterized protein